MTIAFHALVVLVALLHAYFLVLEMFLWTKPLGRKLFGNTVAKAETTKVLAANQGLYNGFLVAGLVWGFLYPQPDTGRHLHQFFLSCIVVAGLYGGYSANKRILFVQALPAAIALALSLAAH